MVPSRDKHSKHPIACAFVSAVHFWSQANKRATAAEATTLWNPFEFKLGDVSPAELQSLV